jgi:hypothetical protein
MSYFAAAIILTSVFYVIVAYMTFFTASILHRGITYKLAVTVLKSSAFIISCYISIISDVILYRSALYDTITYKNGLLLLLVIAALINARDGKETEK